MKRVHKLLGMMMGVVVLCMGLYLYSLFRIQPVALPVTETGGLVSGINQCAKDKHGALIEGWAVLPEDDVNLVQYQVLLKDSQGKFFKLKTFVQSRPDKPNKPADKNPHQYNFSGFQARVLWTMLPHRGETYEVYLFYLNDGKKILQPLNISIREEE